MPSFKIIENKHDLFRIKSCKNANNCSICKEKFENKYLRDKKYHKARDYCHCTEEIKRSAHGICNVKYIVPNENQLAFHNGSNYDYHFTIKEVAQELKKQSTCLGKN